MPSCKAPALNPGAIVPMQIFDGQSGGLVFPNQRFGERMGIVGGIVQHLDLQQLARVLHLADFFEQPLHHVALVIQRKLDGHVRKLGEARGGLGRAIALVLEILPDHLEAVAAVKRKNNQDREIGNQQRPIEKLQTMNARKGIVEQRSAPIGWPPMLQEVRLVELSL